MKIKTIILFIITSFAIHCIAQNPNSDSLENLLRNITNNKQKIKVLHELFLKYEFTNYEKAQSYLSSATVLSKKTNNLEGLATSFCYQGYFEEDKGNLTAASVAYEESIRIFKNIKDIAGQARGYNNLGNINRVNGKYDVAITYLLKALKLFRLAKGDRRRDIANAYNNLGNTYDDKGDYNHALKYLFTALNIRKKLNGKKDIASSYNNIGIIYEHKGDYGKSLKNHFESLKISEQIADSLAISYSYQNIGNVYGSQSNFEQAINYYDLSLKIKLRRNDKNAIASTYFNLGTTYNILNKSKEALSYHQLSLKLFEETEDAQGIAYANNEIGVSYYKIGKIDSAIFYYQKSLDISTEMGDKAGIVAGNISLSACLLQKNNLQLAEQKIEDGIQISLQMGHKEYLCNAYKIYLKLDSLKNDFLKAFEHKKIITIYQDSINSESEVLKALQSKMNFEYEKNEGILNSEHELVLKSSRSIMDLDRKKNNLTLLIISIGLAILCMIAFFVARLVKITKGQNKIIEAQSQAEEKQTILLDQQKEHIAEKQKEIIDSINYAKRIQLAILTSHKYIENNLKRLNQ